MQSVYYKFLFCIAQVDLVWHIFECSELELQEKIILNMSCISAEFGEGVGSESDGRRHFVLE